MNKTLLAIFAALPLVAGCWGKQETTSTPTEDVTPVEMATETPEESADHEEAEHNEDANSDEK